MKRMHVMLRVKSLEESIRFYTELFASGPTVRKADYAKWSLEDPRVNFSISDHDGQAGIEHLGIEAETPAELEELRGRIGRAEGTVSEEGSTTCCYAKSDKTWIVDGQGVAWEAFHTSATAETYTGNRADEGPGAACCKPACCAADSEVDSSLTARAV